LTSIGVKVDTKEVMSGDGQPLKLAIWDVAGIDTPTGLFLRYLRGAAGYLLVADGTRSDTLDRALQLREAVDARHGPIPSVGLINKSDLKGQQEIDDARLEVLRATGTWLRTSARLGDNVEEAFSALTRAMERRG
jgi:GTPase SAR1 family protein